MYQEYLITNATGAYSSADPLLGNTRKYHGLLVVPDASLNRFCVLNRIEEWIEIAGAQHAFSSNLYKDNVVAPDGRCALQSFELLTHPVWKFEIEGVKITKSQVLVRGKNRLIIKYAVSSDKEATLNIMPFVTWRSMHAVQRIDSDFTRQVKESKSLLIQFDQKNMLRIHLDGFRYLEDPDIYKDFVYPVEIDRGYDAYEDLIKTGTLQARVPGGHSEFSLIFDYLGEMAEPGMLNEQAPFTEFNNRLQVLSDSYHEGNGLPRRPVTEMLVRQSDQFVLNTAFGPSVIAGYHWFEDWGRDTFISFPGLFIATRRFDEARALLIRWKELFREGLLPNRPLVSDYNSIDAVFWYAVALWRYVQATEDETVIAEVMPKLEAVMHAMEEGTNKIHVDEDGYIVDGNSPSALTWMDAKIDGVAVTDRSGRAVEIQALWYNFLKIVISLKEMIGDQTHMTTARGWTASLERNFEDDFFNQDTGCLYDRVMDTSKDPAIRPNQVTALSLPFLLTGKRTAKRVLSVCKHELLTDVGLRTLSPSDPDYQPRYHGDQKTRDKAYHQGTIWPYLLGHYMTAVLQVNAWSKKSQNEVAELFDRLEIKLEQDNVRYLAEIYDPQTMTPDGCISQAWSAATILDAYLSLNSA